MRSVEDVLRPDSYWSTHVLIDRETGAMRPYQFSDFYNSTSDLRLNAAVPKNIQQEFDAACHTFIYSWLSFDLATVAEHYAYAVLEMSLRIKLQADGGAANDGRGLKGLFTEAFKRGWLSEQDFELAIVPNGKPLCQLRDFIVRQRNSLSHGEIHRFIQGSELALELCRDVINRLFPDPATTPT